MCGDVEEIRNTYRANAVAYLSTCTSVVLKSYTLIQFKHGEVTPLSLTDSDSESMKIHVHPLMCYNSNKCYFRYWET